MADRSSARAFGLMFRLLADNPTRERARLARELFWHTREFDFDPCQMDADEALEALGVLRTDANGDVFYAVDRRALTPMGDR